LRYRTLSVPAKACTAALSGAGTGAALADAAGNPDANEAAITSITLFIAFSFGIRPACLGNASRQHWFIPMRTERTRDISARRPQRSASLIKEHLNMAEKLK
jgi:hypothetical protein